MQGIEMLHEFEVSNVSGVLCRWRGMNIFLGLMLDSDGKRYLSASLVGAATVERFMEWGTARWIISSEEELNSAATAPIICNGSAPDAIEPSTTEK